MKLTLTKTNYPYKNKESIANMFIIGNGHIGYKGTMEEELSSDKVTFNIIGHYDQYKDKWRESLNLFNPLYLSILDENNNEFHYKNAIHHKVSLKLSEGTLKRVSEFKDITLKTKRFISSVKDDLIIEKINITAKRKITLTILSGIDSDVYEINGPHYKTKQFINDYDGLIIKGITNENKIVHVYLKQICKFEKTTKEINGKLVYQYNVHLNINDTFELVKISCIDVDNFYSLVNKINSIKHETYHTLLKEHVDNFSSKFNNAFIEYEDNEFDSNFALNYSIYELIILGSEKYETSIPARGLSGQVYKGAIFWDTEVFMLPFFLATNQTIAKKLINYRIKTLNGALLKAKTFGYQGAFYAWESQEDGKERCSLYNVTDAKTGKPIRTYFADKQIHISIDVLYGLISYVNYTNDLSILDDSANLMAVQIIKFYMSYAKKQDDGKYHFLDVIGPDEYHERINDNAFTNYSIKFIVEDYLKIIQKNNINIQHLLKEVELTSQMVQDFINDIYLPKQNAEGVIEQFDGYFALKNITFEQFKQQIVDHKEYLGGENGIASKTQIIKQADVCALLALHVDKFPYEVLKANFDYYYQRTEHGSSLSNSMYGLLACKINKLDIAYELFYKSASIDLNKNQKLYAGGIFIGGTHPASNGGAYIDFVYGFLGMKVNNGKISFDPNIPNHIKNIKFRYLENNELKERIFKND